MRVVRLVFSVFFVSFGMLPNHAHSELLGGVTPEASPRSGTSASAVIIPKFSVSTGGRILMDFDRGLAPATERKSSAAQNGAMGKMTFKIVGTDAKPVVGATVDGGFYVGDEKGVSFKVTSDTNGLATVAGMCYGDMNVRITKDGYYNTRFSYWFPSRGNIDQKNGVWLPWNPSVEIVLKQVRRPTAMYVKPDRRGILPPKLGTDIGYDLKRGDFVTPFGEGVVSDFTVRYDYKAGKAASLYYYAKATLTFTNKLDGVYRVNKDLYSELASSYHANTNAEYHKSIVLSYDRISEGNPIDLQLGESEYLVMRTRSEVNHKGQLESAHYSKLYGPIRVGAGGLYMGYYFNDEVNNTNIEADTSVNLSGAIRTWFPP